ncbi:PqqD family protein [Nocardiopsis sp. CA-288880]|uniref:PqqD family protein n=1 Tax=Nocardiopsis sp. CA-288880 TaxID=3239995 RepID=UPI003D955F88
MTTYIPGEAVKFVVQEDGAMLLDLATGKFYGLNPTGAGLWKSLIGGNDPEELAENLAAETDTAPEIVKADVNRLVQDLSERGLIRPEGDGP